MHSFVRFLTNPTKDIDLRKWATEGLAYLTLDADVKEELIEDADALKSLMELSKVSIADRLFGWEECNLSWLQFLR